MEFKLNPIQSHAFRLALDFALQKPQQPSDDLCSSIQSAKDLNSLEIKLPRRSGVTLICHHLCKELDCLTVLPNDRSLKLFQEDHQSMFIEHKPSIATIFQLKEESHLIVSDFERLKMISDALRRSHVILFDAYRAYSDNSAVSNLMNELGKSHRFIMFK